MRENFCVTLLLMFSMQEEGGPLGVALSTVVQPVIELLQGTGSFSVMDDSGGS
jgi:hypothetical protein